MSDDGLEHRLREQGERLPLPHDDVTERTRGAMVAAARESLGALQAKRFASRGQNALRRRRAFRLLPVPVALIVGIAIGVLTTAVAMAGKQGDAASASELSTISTPGHRVPISVRSERRLELLTERESGRATDDVLLMAQRGNTAFFRVPLAGGDACFLRGTLSRDGKAEIGAGICGWDPTPFRPILDLSAVEADGPVGFRVLSIEGFVADGVRTIAVVAEDGEVVAEFAVRDNVYKVTAYPPGRVSVRLLDDAGNVVHRFSYAPRD